MKEQVYQYDPIDDRLHQWAIWAAKGEALGYPRETLLYKMVNSGVIARGYGLMPEPEAKEERLTDAAVSALIEENRRNGTAIVLHYRGKGNVTQKASDMGVSKRTYHYCIAAGKAFIERWLDSIAP